LWILNKFREWNKDNKLKLQDLEQKAPKNWSEKFKTIRRRNFFKTTAVDKTSKSRQTVADIDNQIAARQAELKKLEIENAEARAALQIPEIYSETSDIIDEVMVVQSKINAKLGTDLNDMDDICTRCVSPVQE
jgi:hypothetical protein